MFGRKACDLIRELARTDVDQITPFDADSVNQILGEITEHSNHMVEVLRIMKEGGLEYSQADDSYSTSFILHNTSAKRNKRCLLAYLNNRLQKVKGLRWQLGAVLPEHLKEKLSNSELESFQTYSDILAEYMVGVGMDITVDTKPPKDPFIEVRVLKPTGPILLEDKITHLEPNSVHLVKRADVESLILQGILEHKEF